MPGDPVRACREYFEGSTAGKQIWVFEALTVVDYLIINPATVKLKHISTNLFIRF